MPCAQRCHFTFSLVGLTLACIRTVATALASEGISSGRGSGWALLAADALPPPPITKSDAAFAAEGLEFVMGHETVSLTELNDLFERVPPPGPPAPMGRTNSLMCPVNLVQIRSKLFVSYFSCPLTRQGLCICPSCGPNSTCACNWEKLTKNGANQQHDWWASQIGTQAS